MAGIEEITMRMTEETPLVGFHGRVDSYGLRSIGLIMLDTMSPNCLHSSVSSDFSMVHGGSATEQAEDAEGRIT